MPRTRQFVAIMFTDIQGYTAMMQHDEAFKWLEKTYNERFFWFLSIKVAPDWDVFRNDPRFDEFIKKMNFPE